MIKDKPVIALTMGDPAGVGPEIVLKALAKPRANAVSRPFVIGDGRILKRALSSLAKLPKVSIRQIRNLKELERREDGSIALLDLENVPQKDFVYGTIRPEYGKAAGEYIEKAASLALKGEIHAVVTSPIHKESFQAGGFHYPGHTDMLASLTSTAKYALMLMVGNFRVAHVTLHVSLKEAVERVKYECVLDSIRVVGTGLRALGVQKPRIGVAGLNPHAGDGGLFGDEEAKEIVPAIEEAKKEGLRVEGPFPPDVVFAFLKGSRFDAVLAMYHDQGGIPMKLLGFTWDETQKRWAAVRGVNVTLGLPIIRTSVVHGTAFEIAGKGIADSTSLEEALECAASMARFKFNLT